MNDRTTSDGTEGLSRAEIEALCLMRAVGSGASLADIASRLGLSARLLDAIGRALQPLVAAGHVDVSEERASLTAEGARYLEERLELWLG